MIERHVFGLAERVQCPEGFEGVSGGEFLAQGGRKFLQVAPADLEDGLLAEPSVAVIQVGEQVRGWAGVEIERLELRRFV